MVGVGNFEAAWIYCVDISLISLVNFPLLEYYFALYTPHNFLMVRLLVVEQLNFGKHWSWINPENRIQDRDFFCERYDRVVV